MEDISPFHGTTGTPCFGLLVTSALGFKARVDPFLHAFSPVWSSDSPLVQHLLTVQRSAWQLSLFNPHTRLQVLMEVWARAQTHDHLCGEPGTVYHLTIPAQLGLFIITGFYFLVINKDERFKSLKQKLLWIFSKIIPPCLVPQRLLFLRKSRHSG